MGIYVISIHTLSASSLKFFCVLFAVVSPVPRYVTVMVVMVVMELIGRMGWFEKYD